MALSRTHMSSRRIALLLGAALALAAQIPEPVKAAEPFGFGQPATATQLEAAEVDVRYDGLGLPAGAGSAEDGAGIYQARCATCHGANLEGNKAMYIKPLSGPARHALNMQPFAPPIFAYIRRSMPLTDPGSLSDDEAYAVVAYLMRELGIIDGDNPRLDATTLRQIRMPNRANFVVAPDSGVTVPP